MGIRALLSEPLARYIVQQQQDWISRSVEVQEKWRKDLVKKALHTQFGKDHFFKDINSYSDFREAVPVHDYEDLHIYIDKVKNGEEDILWPGKPLYFAKTSGTTSGTKYIPISRDSISNHIDSARNAILTYIAETKKAQFLDKKLIFLSGSPVLTETGGVLTGRLSGISNHHVPGYLKSNQMPSYETNCIEDWETKLDKIIDETLDQPMSLISGIPPWVQMYFDKITERTGKKIKDVFPDFSLFIYGGVNFEPYRAKLFESIGKRIDSIELYPASEGFFAYQNSQQDDGLLLLLDTGIFYEFIPVENFFDEKPKRLSIGEVEIGQNYAVIVNNNAGLWGYSLGDTVRFVSLNPYKILVTGRIKHFISAFGEHVIGEEIEKALRYAMERHPEVEVIEFTVAPMVNSENGGLPYHEWLVEFAVEPNNKEQFVADIDRRLTELNIYYKDLIKGSILKTLELVPLRKNSFIDFMRANGKLGGQNKVPRLANDRKIADELININRQ
ncbi:GH3 auxin-responsive promoter family protein [Dyadobacter chenwenxiniae]|uniref:GH3 auxin-responsive promoter family protein n=1 Tax=Dyadobacter chenwenxiniae TaxID=2906456 RepID=A0A9X1TDR3_9BACT|nr:GH3 auxin-responsive promoter family protein [Dyadobacter chenwenxiniae]MCF0062186.1 GH3 auxin-responsive promoter family protein [Dyadobacter chenwenxiniae]UON81988.1 GH3 auxin-responsive promoter family protein [Dyadobacter chenwenxiniae]